METAMTVKIVPHHPISSALEIPKGSKLYIEIEDPYQGGLRSSTIYIDIDYPDNEGRSPAWMTLNRNEARAIMYALKVFVEQEEIDPNEED
jgi:hypothetical protein